MTESHEYDLILRNGLIHDGLGGAPYVGDVAVSGDTIEAVGSADKGRGRTEIDVSDLVVASGFINMLIDKSFKHGTDVTVVVLFQHRITERRRV